MVNRVQTLRSSVAGNRPAAGSRAPGELYVNFADRIIGYIDPSKNPIDLSSVTVGETPPAIAFQGDLWYDSVAGQLYLYYDDGNSKQWVAASNVDLPAYLPLAGGAMTGPIVSNVTTGFGLDISPGAGANAGILLNAPSSGFSSAIQSKTNGVVRWELELGDETPETGGNQGSNFALGAFSDAGAYLGTYLTIDRATGFGVFSGNISQRAPDGSWAGIIVDAAAGQGKQIAGATRGSARWSIELGDASLETGGNVGSSFSITSYNDAAGVLNNVVRIDRANSAFNLSGNLWVTPPAGGSTITVGKNNLNVSTVTFTDGTNDRADVRFDHASGVMNVTNNLASTVLQLDAGGNFLYSGGSGAALKAGGGPWGATSDARIKTVQAEYKQGLGDVTQLRPVVYAYRGNDTPTKDGPSPHAKVAADKKPFIGLIAQEVEKIFPGTVGQHAGFIDGIPVSDIRDLDTGPLIFALINSVKELKAELDLIKMGTR